MAFEIDELKSMQMKLRAQNDELKSMQMKLRAQNDEQNLQIRNIRHVLRRYRVTYRTRRSHMKLPSLDIYHNKPHYQFPIQKMFTRHGPLNAEDAMLEIRNILRS
jgi:hypothetical protein